MQQLRLLVCLFAATAALETRVGNAQESYPIHPDSQRRSQVPQGNVTSHRITDSKIYPGTERDYFVYVPAQYDGSEPAALMVFQDGKNDQDIYAGSWWNANLTMLSALQWAGYQVKHEWGEGGHNGKHGGAIFPDAMRRLWADADQPIQVSTSEHPELKDRLIDGEDWRLVSEGHQYTEGPAVAPDGSVYFVDGPAGEVWKVNANGRGATKFIGDIPGVSALMFDAQGNLYCARNKAKTLTRVDTDGSRHDLASGVSCNDLVVLDHGVYFTGPTEQTIWYLPHGGRLSEAAKGPKLPNGLITTPDQKFLLVVDAAGRYVWSYRIAEDGQLHDGQPYSYVHSPQDEMNTGADGATMTEDGSLLVATTLGIQLFDQLGRVHVIFDRPRRPGRLSNCVFAGQDMNVLYVTSGSSVFHRTTKIKGIAPWQPAVVPAKPRL